MGWPRCVRCHNWHLVVHSSKPHGLLGRDFIWKLCPQTLSIHSTQEHAVPVMKVNPVRIEIEDRSSLKFCRAIPVPLSMKQAVEDTGTSLEKRGIIRKDESSQFASPVVWIKKKDSKLRICADLKVHINKSIKSDSYPLPCLEGIFSEMAGATAFTRLDLKEAYPQIPLHSESRELYTLK